MRKLLLLFVIVTIFAVRMILFAEAQDCITAPPSRLSIGEPTRVTLGLPNNIRALPGQSGDLLGEIPGGGFFEVLEGPTCSSNMYWWRVRYEGIEGWTPEGVAGDYWLEPQRLIPTDTPTPTFTPTFTPTATFTLTPSHTPTITLTPSVTPTLPSIAKTAAAIGLDLHVTSNREWQPLTMLIGGIEMQLVPSGCYNRGLTDRQISEIQQVCQNVGGFSRAACDYTYDKENIDQDICFQSPFWIDTYEVSNIQYSTIGAGGEILPRLFNYVDWGRDFPQVNINHDHAAEHCMARGARLPYDIEWEYAARGPNGNLFVWGGFYEDGYAKHRLNAEYFYNTDGSSILKPSPYGTTPDDRSWVGAYDMASNVSERVISAYPRANSNYIVVGGSNTLEAHDNRTTTYLGGQAYRNFTGFRCVRDFFPDDLNLLLENE